MIQDYLDEAPCIFFAFDEEGILGAVNQTLCAMLGYSREALPGKNLSAIVTLATRIFFQTHFFPLLRLKGEASEIFITLLSQNGDEWPMMINVKRHSVTQQLVGIGISIQNRNKYEEGIIAAKKFAEKALSENKELQQAKAELQQHTARLDVQLTQLQQQNENLHQLNWTLTHTMQEPLRKISLFSSRLLQQGFTLETVGVSLHKINDLALHSRQLVIHLQQYVQMGLLPEKEEMVPLLPLLENIVQPFIEAGHHIQVNLNSSQVIKGFPAGVKILFDELVVNAIRFRQPGATAAIVIEGTMVKANAYRMFKEKYQYSDYLKIVVSDTGIGFKPQYKEQIFGLFTKLLPASSGFGVGLALCKKIMDLHKGFILADSNEGKGAVFSCFFPVDENEADTILQGTNEALA